MGGKEIQGRGKNTVGVRRCTMNNPAEVNRGEKGKGKKEHKKKVSTKGKRRKVWQADRGRGQGSTVIRMVNKERQKRRQKKGKLRG